MVTLKHDIYDAANYLNTEEDMVAYLEAALEENNSALVVQALSTIARARGIADIARDTGLSRKALKEVFSPEGNPDFSSVLKVVHALGIRLHAEMEHATP
jgi:probable addiction module antidote protein